MVAEFAAIISSIKSLHDLFAAGKPAGQDKQLSTVFADLRTQVEALQTAALASEQERTALRETIRHQEDEIAKLTDWQAEAERYQLISIAAGIVAYTVKPGSEQGDPPHYLCPNCYQKREKAFLQLTKTPNGWTYVCQSCRTPYGPSAKFQPAP